MIFHDVGGEGIIKRVILNDQEGGRIQTHPYKYDIICEQPQTGTALSKSSDRLWQPLTAPAEVDFQSHRVRPFVFDFVCPLPMQFF